MTEAYVIPPEVQFLSALLDVGMLEPSSIGTNQLFPTSSFVLMLEQDASINNGSGFQITAPIQKPIMIIRIPYGSRKTYMSEGVAEDWYLSQRITMYANTGSDIQDIHDRLIFSMQYRSAIFSSYSLFEVGIDEHPRAAPYDAKRGFATEEYTIRYRFCI